MELDNVVTGRRSAFISYSRKDYYFAESLAFQLEKRGIPAWLDAKDLKPGVDWGLDLEAALDEAGCLILVASSEALSSPNVRAELERARSARKRIIVARFRGGGLRAELHGVETVDFRGTFATALEKLAGRLGSRSASLQPLLTVRQDRFTAWLPRVPPWVGATALCLGGVTVFPLLYPLFRGRLADVGTGDGVALLSIVTLSIWYFFVAFLRRRMGMTRLALCFIILAGVVAYALLFPPVASDPGQLTMRDRWGYSVALLGMAALGVGIVLFKRPEDLLRWAPTGKAWTRYRVGRTFQLEGDAGNILASLRQVQRFHLLHDEEDAPAAERLRQELLRVGATEASAAEDDATALLLLTNRTRSKWIANCQNTRRPLITLVATTIRLPDSLAWLWRRQWLDLRRWDLQEDAVEDRLLKVPEALTQVRVPSVISLAHYLLCATGTLFFVASSALTNNFQVTTDMHAVHASFAYLALSWSIPAWRLLTRSITEANFFRYVLPGFMLTVPLCGWELYEFAVANGQGTRASVAGAFLVSAPAWFWRKRASLRFWFPKIGRSKTSSAQKRDLEPTWNWGRILWSFLPVFLFMMLWMFLLDQMD